MRGLVALLVVGAVLFGIYKYHFQNLPTTDTGTAPTQAITLTGVREDLIQIAHAENGYIGQNGHCGSLRDLTSSDALSMSHTERDGYSYEVNCGSGSDFTVTARHAPAPAGSLVPYPTLTIDQSMEVR